MIRAGPSQRTRTPARLAVVILAVCAGATEGGASAALAQSRAPDPTPQDRSAVATALAGAPVTPLDLTYEYLTRQRLPEGELEARYRHVIRTSDGYIWYTRGATLGRYQGRRTFVYEPLDSDQLAFQILALHEDSRGFLWVGTAQGELIRHEGAGLSAIHRFDTEVRDIATAADGAVWVALGDGVGRWQDGGVSTFQLSRAGGGATHVLVDDSGVVWAGTGEGLYRLSDGVFQRIADEDAAWRRGVTHLYKDRRGRLWASTPDAIMYRDREGEFGLYESPELPTGGVRKIIEHRDGDLWFLYPDGLRRLPSSEQATGLGTVPTFVPIEGGVDVATGAEGILWVHAPGTGVQYVKQSPFATSRPIWDTPVVVSSVAPDGDSAALVVAGCDVKQIGLQGIREIPPEFFGPNVSCVRSIMVATDGAVWAGHDGGIVRRGPDGALDRIPVDGLAGLPSDAEPSFVSHLVEDDGGRIWYAVAGVGIGRYSRTEEAAFYKLGPSYDDNQIRALTSDREGAVWFVTRTGFGRIAAGELERWPSDTVLPGAARDVHVDRDGVVWIGSDNVGVLRIEGSSRRLVSLGRNLGSMQFSGMLEDHSGNVYLLTPFGVAVIALEQLNTGAREDSDTGWFLFLNALSDGAPKSGLDCVGGWTTRDGNVWFVHGNGVAVIDPARLRLNEVPPPVYIQMVTADGERLVERDGAYAVPAGAHLVQMTFVALTLDAYDGAAYRHRLEGHDDDWVHVEPVGQAEYHGLWPGRYTFRVLGRNNHGVWNEEGASVQIRVRPLWWQTIWFMAAVVLGLMAAGAALQRLRTRSVRWRNIELEREIAARQVAEGELKSLDKRMITAQERDRERIARELHDDISQRIHAETMAAAVAVEAIATDPEEAKARLQALLDRLDQVADDARQISHELHPATLAVLGLAPALEGLCEEFEATSKVTLRVSVPETVPRQTSQECALCLYRIVQEALTNVSKHAAATEVEIDLSVQDDHLALRIRDNGVGFDPETIKLGLGLASIRERARLLDGKLDIDSVPGEGTILVIALPIQGTDP